MRCLGVYCWLSCIKFSVNIHVQITHLATVDWKKNKKLCYIDENMICLNPESHCPFFRPMHFHWKHDAAHFQVCTSFDSFFGVCIVSDLLKHLCYLCLDNLHSIMHSTFDAWALVCTSVKVDKNSVKHAKFTAPLLLLCTHNSQKHPSNTYLVTGLDSLCVAGFCCFLILFGLLVTRNGILLLFEDAVLHRGRVLLAAFVKGSKRNREGFVLMGLGLL